jgi:predicted GNAT superfamily acetyltransferase
MPNDTIASERARDTRERAEAELAVAAMHPERFGLRRHREGWRKSFPGLGEVLFAPLGWQDAQCPSWDTVAGERQPVDALTLVVRLQARVWGMPPEELVPVNLLAVLPDTGGSVLVAYREDDGFNAEGWLGFCIGAGSSTGTFVSHMLGVREEQRGTRDLGWHLKLLQGYEALRAGHRSAVWTFDPMRGANARLNLEKLGARVRELTLDKYGVLRSDLYGDAPSDRFTVFWDLLSPTTHRRIEAVRTDRYPGPEPAEVRALPAITPENAEELAATAPRGARYRIPADVDELMTVDAHRATAWRGEMRAALSPFMTVKAARVPEQADCDPIAVGVDVRFGAYDVVAFASEGSEPSTRENWYVLRRRGGEG